MEPDIRQPSATGLSLVIALVSAVSGFLIGYDTAVIAGALAPISDEFGLSTMSKQVVVTSVLVGALIGALGSGPFAGRFGQRITLLVASIIYILAAASFLVADDAFDVILSRTILGLAVGASSMVAPLYVAETAPRRWRGALVSMIQLAITVGILASYLVGYVFDDAGDWRAMLGGGAIPGVVLFVGMLLLPESPRWLLLKGRTEAARRDFQRIRGHPWDEAEIDMVLSALDKSVSWRELFGRAVVPVLLLASGLFLFQNLSGIDAILYYSPVIFGFIGFEGSTGQILATAGLGAVNVVATVLAMWLVDRSGRRPLLIGGTAVMAVSISLLAISLGFEGQVAWANRLAAASLAIYITAFALSLGPLPYVLMSEIFPLRVRSLGMSIAAATAWALNICVTLTFLTLVEWIGPSSVFWLYGGVCLAAMILAYRLVPETRNRSLEEIEANLEAGLPTRRLGDRRSADSA